MIWRGFAYFPYTLPVAVAILAVTGCASVKVIKGGAMRRTKIATRNVVRAGAVVVALNAAALFLVDIALLLVAIWATKTVAIAVFACAPLFLVVIVECVIALLIWSATVPLDDNFSRGP